MVKYNALQRMVAVVGLAIAGSAGAALPPAGSHAPDFVLKSLSGRNERLSEYRGDVVLLSFWASWCGECTPQLEHAANLQARYGDAGVRLLAVSLDRERRSAASGIDAESAAFPVLHDVGSLVGKAYDVRKLPTLLLIGRDGVVRDVFEGYERGDETTYLARLREVLREL